MAVSYSKARDLMETQRFLIASSADQWAEFLRVSCKFESYSFENQIMLQAQRINPTAVASYEHWNNVQECSVIRGRKGIALFNEYGSGLRYVFDAADVREIHDKNRNGHKPVLWTMEERHKDTVLDGLQKRYGDVISGSGFEEQVKAYINAAVGDFILSEPEYLQADREIQDLIFSSVEFAVLNRMGLSPSAGDYPDFNNISKYIMDEEALHAIGNATQKVSGSMLREIGRDINRYDMERISELGIEGIYTARKAPADQLSALLENPDAIGLANAPEKVHNAVVADNTNRAMEGENNGGTDVHESGRLSVPEHDGGSAAGGEADEVRENEGRVYEGTPAGGIFPHEVEGDTGSSLSGDSGTGGEDAGHVNDADGGSREDNGRIESARSSGLDSSHEPDNGSGGGASASERGLQLEYTGEQPVYEQLSLFAPDEMEQIGSIMAKGSHSYEPVPAGYVLSRLHLEDILRSGSGQDNSRHRIWNQFSLGKSPEEIIDFLKTEYRQCGKGFTIEGNNISMYAEKDGIRFGFGESAFDQPINIRIEAGREGMVNGLLPWENVENILRGMVRVGDYLSAGEAFLTPEIERNRVARIISFITSVYVVDDGTGQDHDMASVSVLPEKLYGSEEEKAIRDLLSTKSGMETVHAKLIDLIAQKDRKEIIQRFRNIYSLELAAAEVEDMMREHIEFPTQKEVKVLVEDFITQDEIDGCLGRGSGVEHGSFRIYDYFMEGHDSKDTANFLKNEYGNGGRSHAIAGAEHSWENHDAKGIKLDKGNIMSPYTTILLSWTAVEKRIRKLIEEDKYLSPEGKIAYAKYKEEQAQKELKEAQENLEQEDNEPDVTGSEGELSWHIVHDMDDDNGQPAEWAAKMPNGEFLLIDRETDGYVLYNTHHASPLSISETLDRAEKSGEEYAEGVIAAEKRFAAAIPDLPVGEKIQETEVPKAGNFHITDDALGTGGAKEKFERNIHAIETLKQIEAENRDATYEEQVILSQYVGWGGLSDAFDANKANWSNEYATLQSILTPEEYAAARRSTLDAFYTSPVIIREIYQKMADMGFEGGNVLEPSCAVGNFLGMMPEKMQQASKLFGVELDSISGRIAQKLYPDAEISISGYENASLSDDFFDIAVGNVPFGEVRPFDKTYAKENFLIHDYFFAKTLDKVRSGGVIAFITSKGTMDKQSDEVRRYIAERADFLGAVRLPDTAFKANAGTEVTSDIIFLQKRDEVIQLDNDNLPPWCSLSADENGISMNRYFAEHPEQICGSMQMVSGPFGPVSTCKEDPDRPLSDQLKMAMSNIHGVIDKSFVQMQTENSHETHTIPADDQVRNYSYAVVDGKVYYKHNATMEEIQEKPDTLNRIKDMCAIRDAVQDVLNVQIRDSYNETAFKEKQAHLNAVYDAFEKKYGRIGSKTNKRAFEDDAAYCLLRSLEKYDDDGNFKEKTAIFTKRTVKPIIQIESCENSLDALFASLSEKATINLGYMSSLCGRTKEEMLSDLTGIIFQNPRTNKYETAEEYLSGNVREKLEFAQDMVAHGYEEYAINVKHLEQVQPEELKASEIAVRLGATWIEPEYIDQFMKETFEMPERLFRSPYYWRKDSLSECGATMNQYTNEWTVRGKRSYDNAIISSTYGSSRRNALLILEDSLNLRDSRVYDTITDPATNKEYRKLNQKETIIVQQKQELLKEKFNDWIFADPDRREYLVEKYNRLFNSVRPRTYDGSHLTFNGISNGITLNPHQKDAIARVLYGGNTLLAHAVGAGKTYEMVAAAMESKRLGLCNKSMFVVPNHLTEQWGANFMKLYPNANILVATKKDFEPANRKEFCSRIATGDYDAVIIGHTQFERIPLSPERIAESMNRQIDDIQNCIDATLESEGRKSPSVKQLEKQKQTLQRRIKLLNDAPKDDVVTFEQLGVDRLFVDESHNFKNLFTYTKMRNVGGISTTEAKKSTDLYQKCQYLDEITGGKGIVFASGTPISNSMTELFTNMRYLQGNKLRQMNLQNFDAWASTFGETQTAMELAPEGTGYRSKTRFAKFFNLPELMNIFKEVADVKTSDMLNLDVPEAVYEDVVTEPSQYQKDIVSSLADRAEAVRSGSVDRHNDNMLKITNDGRMAALDQRLINPMLPDDPNSKVNNCVEKAFAIWDETKADRLTQVIFCDLSTPSKNGRFNVYDDIKKKLVERGVPEREIAFIHDADTDTKKANLFSKVRSGEVRFILGSTPKLGAGTNIQHKLTALHHLDVPWRPSDIEQQEGRIIRQHNTNEKVKIFRYITKDTFDAYSWQLIENKQKFIGQIMTSKSPVRMADDVDEQALNYAEIKALATGNPLIKEKMDLDIQVNKLKMLKGAYQSSVFQMQDNITKVLPRRIARNEEYIADLKQDMALYAEKKAELGRNSKTTETLPLGLETDVEKDSEKEPFRMKVCGVTYDSRVDAGNALIAACRDIKTADTSFEVGEFCGFKMSITFDAMNKRFVAGLQGDSNKSYVVDLDSSAIGNTIRIRNTLENLGRELDNAQKRLSDAKNELETAQREVSKPFSKEEEYQEKLLRLLEVNRLLEQGDKSVDQDDITQLVNNINYVVDGYLEQISDYGDPLLSGEELIDMCKAEIFDIMADGTGSCKEEKGICDSLRSLGDDVIAENILEHGQEVLAEKNPEKSFSLSSIKRDNFERKCADQMPSEHTTLKERTL